MRNFILFLASALLATPAIAQEAPAMPPQPKRLCSCEIQKPGEIVEFIGVVSDAEVLLDETGANQLPRQASIFRIVRAPSSLKAPVKIWHTTDTKRCGVQFNYGAQYYVKARKVGEELETDYCLMKGVHQTTP
jgi:hypothetical protein